MKRLIVAIILTVCLGLMFAAGAFSAQVGFLIVGFCGLPFGLFAMGWTAKAALAGKHFALITDEMPARTNRLSEHDPAPRPQRVRSIDRQV